MSDNPLKERRIKDADAARTVWNKWRKDSDFRRSRWARVLNQLDGAPPLSNTELVRLGQGWRSNINFRDASSTLDQVLISYWRLLHDTPNLLSLTIVGSDDPNNERYEQIFQEAFNRFYDDWGADYVRNYLMFSFNHVAFGVGVTHWKDRFSPRWEVVKLGDLELPAKAKASVEKLTSFGLQVEMEIEELYDLIRTPEKRKSASDRGWNVAELDRVLYHAVNGSAPRDGDDVLETQREIRNNALGVSTEKGPVKLIYLYVREYDGKISQYITTTGSEATDFERRPYSVELGLCQRYFFKGGNGSLGIFATNSIARFSVVFPTMMRDAPVITANTLPYVLNPTVAESQAGSQTADFLATASGGTVDTRAASKIQMGGFSSGADGRPAILLNNCLNFSAEL